MIGKLFIIFFLEVTWSRTKEINQPFTNVDITFLPCGLYFVILHANDGREFIFKLAKE